MIGLPPTRVAPERSHPSLTVTGFDTVCAARIFHKLMKRLGFKKFYAQGGDWGCLITTNMAQLEPRYDLTTLHSDFIVTIYIPFTLCTSLVCWSDFLEIDPGGR